MPDVVEAAAWGLLGASSLVLGAALSFGGWLSVRAVGLVLAFGAGVLMSAVAYELVADALTDQPWIPLYALAFAGGAVTFYVGSTRLDSMPEPDAAGSGGRSAAGRGQRARGAAIVLGAVLDGIPESVVLGVSLLDGGAISVPMLLAVFISNVPEALGASADLTSGGVSRGDVIRLWTIVALASAVAAGLGYVLLSDAPARWISAVQMFAGGAIVAMLAESMFPDAYEQGGRAVGLATAFGFALSAILSAVR